MKNNLNALTCKSDDTNKKFAFDKRKEEKLLSKYKGTLTIADFFSMNTGEVS